MSLLVVGRLPAPSRRKTEPLLYLGQTLCCLAQGKGVGGGSGANWDKKRRYEAGANGIGGVRALRARQRIDARGAGSRSEVT